MILTVLCRAERMDQFVDLIFVVSHTAIKISVKRCVLSGCTIQLLNFCQMKSLAFFISFVCLRASVVQSFLDDPGLILPETCVSLVASGSVSVQS